METNVRTRLRGKDDAVDSLCGRDVIDVIAQGHEEIKEELRTAVVHLQLHGAAPLEGASAANDESEVVGPQLGVRVWGVGVGIAC